MQRMTHNGWQNVDKPTGFANSTCGDIFIRILLIIMGIGAIALMIYFIR
jgi:hypothetical protein